MQLKGDFGTQAQRSPLHFVTKVLHIIMAVNKSTNYHGVMRNVTTIEDKRRIIQ